MLLDRAWDGIIIRNLNALSCKIEVKMVRKWHQQNTDVVRSDHKSAFKFSKS